MSMPDPVGGTCWPSNYGCGDADKSKFICCVDGRNTKVNEVWVWGEDGITPEVHPALRVGVDSGLGCKFATNYLTENGFKTSIFCKKSINVSFEFLVVPDPLITCRPYWIDNILVHIPSWGVGGTVKNLNWGSQLIGRYSGVSLLWRGYIPARPAYLPRSPENTCATAHHVRDDLL